MKRKLIIHVGLGKTGSSSIQFALKKHDSYLKENGIKYLGLMLEQFSLDKEFNWHKASGWNELINLPKETLTKQFLSAFIEINEKLPENIHTLIWSNESLFNSFDKIDECIKCLKSYYDISVVGYIRNPGSWIQSAYLQWGIKHKSYKGPLKRFVQWVSSSRYIVTPFIGKWKSLDVPVMFYNADALDDVCKHFLSQNTPNITIETENNRSNKTPPPIAIALFAYYNSLSKDMVLPNEIQPLLAKSGVLSGQQNMPFYNNLMPNHEDIQSYLHENRLEIEKVNAYFTTEGQPSFSSTEPSVKDQSVSQQDINRALLQIIVHLSREIDRLKKNHK